MGPVTGAEAADPGTTPTAAARTHCFLFRCRGRGPRRACAEGPARPSRRRGALRTRAAPRPPLRSAALRSRTPFPPAALPEAVPPARAGAALAAPAGSGSSLPSRSHG